jgi:hypothetical protein
MPRFLTSPGYLPSVHPMNVSNNYTEGEVSGHIIRIALDDIVVITDVDMSEVVKDCKIFVAKSSANEREKAEELKKFCTVHGETCAAIKMRGDWHVYFKCSSDTVIHAIHFMNYNVGVIEVDVDKIPPYNQHIDEKA